MAVATWEDVAVALGRPSSDFNADQQAQMTYWLNGAEIIVRGRLGDLALLDQDVLKYVETEVVAAKVRSIRDDGASSISVSVDDGTVTRRYESVTSADFTGEFWTLLSPAGGASAYTIALASPVDLPREIA